MLCHTMPAVDPSPPHPHTALRSGLKWENTVTVMSGVLMSACVSILLLRKLCRARWSCF